jgi:hypothetical protein
MTVIPQKLGSKLVLFTSPFLGDDRRIFSLQQQQAKVVLLLRGSLWTFCHKQGTYVYVLFATLLLVSLAWALLFIFRHNLVMEGPE